jgi:membrane-associated HD superfamily phosphohydrolase
LWRKTVKMETTRILGRILYYLTRLAAWLYLATGLYAFGVFLVYRFSPSDSVPLEIFEPGNFHIFYPFTRIPFLVGEYTKIYMFTILAILFGYGIFLWLLSKVFYAFSLKKIFTTKSVKDLSSFYFLNLVVPVSILLFYFFVGESLADIVVITCLHFVIGIFAYFMAAIFRQGLLLQEEQDLTL